MMDNTAKNKYDNPMRRNVMSLPSLLKEKAPEIKEIILAYADKGLIAIPQRIIITGCGDSLAAARAGKIVIETLSGIPTEVMPSLDASRFLSRSMIESYGKNTTMIAVSSSGLPVRTTEAIERARKYGMNTIAMTGSPDSPLGKAAEVTIPLEIPRFEAGNGVRSFMISILSLYSLAARLATMQGKISEDECEKTTQEFMTYADDVEKALPELDEEMKGIAIAENHCSIFDFIGSGPSAATAWFAHAKIIETTGDPASENGIEDWFHINCFLREYRNIFTMIITQTGGNEQGRVQELLDALKEMKRRSWIVTEDDDYIIHEGCYEIRMPKAPRWWMSPLFNQIPISLISGYLCEIRGEAYGRGCVGPWEICRSADLLNKCEKKII